MKFGNMSKIGKKPIIIPAGVEVSLNDGVFEIKGKQGAISVNLLQYVSAEIKDKNILLTIGANHKQARANWGTMGSLLQNAVKGTAEGFTRVLEIEGIGYNASMEGATLVLKVGFTHPVKFIPPEGIRISVEKGVIKVSGANKATVGEAAAQIRKIKKPEPYKGKGIRYQGEVIRRKEGKKVAGATASS